MNNDNKCMKFDCHPKDAVLFSQVFIPASVRSDKTEPPMNGEYTNALVLFEATNHAYIYSSDGIPTYLAGAQGPQGEQGEKGDTGEQGPQGIQGIQGPKGDTGEKGDKGDTGEKGEQGEQGIQGPQGPQGIQGIQGEKGEKGDAGMSLRITGEVDTYEQLPTNLVEKDAGKAYIVSEDSKLYVWTGSSFPAKGEGSRFVGPKGDKGDQGEQGVQGEQGIQGVQGIQGEKGDKGDKGDTGERGPQGEQGIQGIQGLKGDTGEKGDKGDTGNGVASVVLNADDGLDFTMTDGSHLTTASVRGPQGVKGDTGAKGDKGDKGDQGEQGIQGVQGETGPQGPAGENGTDGAPGEKGEKGDTGPAGPAGADGPGYTAAVITDGTLYLTDTDGVSHSVGYVKGEKGDTGEQGPAGIQGVQGPVGPEGPAGPSQWGGIKGTLSTQTDLNNALNDKLSLSKTSTQTMSGALYIGGPTSNVGNAYTHQRKVTSSITGKNVNGVAFAVAATGEASFQHKTFNDAGTGGVNDSVIRFWKGHLQFASNTGSGNVPTEDMYKEIATQEYADNVKIKPSNIDLTAFGHKRIKDTAAHTFGGETDIISVSLPAGTWLVTSTSNIEVLADDYVSYRIQANSVNYGHNSGYMTTSNGARYVAHAIDVVELSATTTVKVQVFSNGANKGKVTLTYFNAVRLG